ncbi:gamma-glutamyltransferase [Leptolyngbya sp. FACHB-261]|uniref:gamma-glutamyltransferase n=1 Tax=Leptolyngbya sp. FACHB-261 TaxID=2692806 RepID=UPI001687824F|nr:gamma-glutamyltransferase [Leptolyngbya sp. FACHB-261]MBD2104050.1 gamma-glutamyltransferase [Leptolyngbya sp. FACHB-261]
MRRRLAALLSAIFCLGLVLSLSSTPPRAQSSPSEATARGRGGAATTESIYATQAAIGILKAGGNAVDAAVAAAAVLGVTEPFSAGIGGGGFMLLYRQSDKQVITLDGREKAPASARVDMFKNPDDPAGGNLPFSPNRISNGLAVGVPGTVLTWVEALNRYGTLKLEQALAPAIDLAEKGFEVDATFAQQVAQNQARFAAFAPTQALFLPQGKPPQVGTHLTNPDLAKTYRLIAQNGPNVFYRGEIGRAIVETVRKPPTVANPPFRVLPGSMTLADLDQYDLRIRPPVSINYRGYQLYGMGLPSSGGITSLETLNLLATQTLASPASTSDPVQAWHWLLEAERLAYADRNAYLGDPEYIDVPVAGLLSRDYAQIRQQQIGARAPEGKMASAVAGEPWLYQDDPSPSRMAMPVAQAQDHEGLSTTHLTVADRLGNVVSYTLTIETTGGSGMVVPGYGFLLNNELTDFDPVSPHANSPEPGKRPRSSIAPTLALAPDGRVIAFGSPGGSTIITTVLGIAMNLIDFRLPLDQAITAPRLSQRNGEVTQVDGGFATSRVGQALAALGHKFESLPEIGAANGIVINPDGTMLAAAEPVRRGGGSAMTVAPLGER